MTKYLAVSDLEIRTDSQGGYPAICVRFGQYLTLQLHDIDGIFNVTIWDQNSFDEIVSEDCESFSHACDRLQFWQGELMAGRVIGND